MKNQQTITPINEDLNVAKYEAEEIKQKIYTIRGKQVMLDKDLAKLYNCKNGTKTVNQAVKRNIERFPERFMFQLTEEEYNSMWSQTGTTSDNKTQKYRRKEHLPFAFTEQGVAMLTTVIRTDIAISMSIKIMDAFVKMRRYIANNKLILEKINNMELKQIEYQKITDKRLNEHENKFENLFKEFDKNQKEAVTQKIFFDGQIVMDDSMTNLKYHYMDKKVIELKLKEKVDFSNVEGIKILKEKANNLKIEIDTNKTDLTEVLKLIDPENIVDINISNTPLEEIISTIYKKGGTL